MFSNLTGWRTLLFNALVVVLTALLHWAVGVDWVTYVGPTWSVVILGGANMVLRWITTTPIGQPA